MVYLGERMSIDNDLQLDNAARDSSSPTTIARHASKQVPPSQQEGGDKIVEALSADESPSRLDPALTPTTVSSSEHSHQQLTGKKSLLEEDDDDDIMDATPSGGEGSGRGSSARSLQNSPPYHRPIRVGEEGGGLYVDVEERDQPQFSNTSASASESHFFRPIGGFEYNQDWDDLYATNLCSQGLLPGCQIRFAEQLDIMTNCHHPFSIFGHDHNFSEDVMDDDHPVSMHHAAYNLPPACEYCGASATDRCSDACQRPKLFFKKKRPPFCPLNPDKWEESTDYAIIKQPKPQQAMTANPPKQNSNKGSPSTDDEETSRSPQERRPSLPADWISELFRNNRTDSNADSILSSN